MRPQPFSASFIPRTERVKEVFEKEAEEAADRLRKYDGETKVRFQDFFSGRTVYDDNKH